MASIKVKFRPSTVADHEGTIFYQIIHERRVRQFLSDYKVFPEEWDERRSMVTVARDSDRRSLIISIRESIRRDVERLKKIDRKLDADGPAYTAEDVIDEYKRYCEQYTLLNFIRSSIARLKQNGRIRTAETYKSTLNSFRNFLSCRDDGGDDIMLDAIDSDMMEAYEAWLRKRGVTPNTISFYTRILRAVYNRAVEENMIENRYPFRKVYTGIDKTVKRALPLPVIKKLKALDLTKDPKMDFARDMFLMSFYLRGMSFIDMAFLKKSDLRNSYVSYRRRKTGRRLVIAWTKEMQMILDKYPENQSDYLLPIIRNSGTNERSTYRNIGYNINHNLKTLAGMVGVSIPLTLYVARHSWASAARSKGIPLSVISEGMGHENESTTRIYLAGIDTAVVDKANSLILSSL